MWSTPRHRCGSRCGQVAVLVPAGRHPHGVEHVRRTSVGATTLVGDLERTFRDRFRTPQGPCPSNTGRNLDAFLSCSDGHMSWSMRGAGGRDQTGMASLEGAFPADGAPSSTATAVMGVPLRRLGSGRRGPERGAVGTRRTSRNVVEFAPSSADQVLSMSRSRSQLLKRGSP